MKSLFLVITAIFVFFEISCTRNINQDIAKKSSGDQNKLLKIDSTNIEYKIDTIQSKNANEVPIKKDSTERILNLNFLKDYNGKYPYEVKLLENKIIIEEITNLIGEKFSYLKKIWNVEVPMEINNDVFVASACKAHDCGYTNAIIVIKLDTGEFFVGIRTDNKVRTYYDENSSPPKQMIDWANNNF